MSRRNNDDLYEGKTIGELLVEGFEEFADVLKADKKAVLEKFRSRTGESVIQKNVASKKNGKRGI